MKCSQRNSKHILCLLVCTGTCISHRGCRICVFHIVCLFFDTALDSSGIRLVFWVIDQHVGILLDPFVLSGRGVSSQVIKKKMRH